MQKYSSQNASPLALALHGKQGSTVISGIHQYKPVRQIGNVTIKNKKEIQANKTRFKSVPKNAAKGGKSNPNYQKDSKTNLNKQLRADASI